MKKLTSIQWTDRTFNGWTGCTKISDGCKHCYAEAWSRRAGPKVGQWGAGARRVRTTDRNWALPKRWNQEAWVECATCGWRGDVNARSEVRSRPGVNEHCPQCMNCEWNATRQRVFTGSLSDWLDNEVPIEWLLDLLELVRCTPRLDWLFVTKRIGAWRRRIEEALNLCRKRIEAIGETCDARPSDTLIWLQKWLDGAAPENVWMGITVCNQLEADRDILKLLAVHARIRFLSVEPMLSAIDLESVAGSRYGHGSVNSLSGQVLDFVGANENGREMFQQGPQVLPKIDWVICGGESGPWARPIHPDWERTLRDQCLRSGVPFLLKQHGEYAYSPIDYEAGGNVLAVDQEGNSWALSIQPGDILRKAPGRSDWTPYHGLLPIKGLVEYRKVGKTRSGRILDGVVHHDFPMPSSLHHHPGADQAKQHCAR